MTPGPVMCWSVWLNASVQGSRGSREFSLQSSLKTGAQYSNVNLMSTLLFLSLGPLARLPPEITHAKLLQIAAGLGVHPWPENVVLIARAELVDCNS